MNHKGFLDWRQYFLSEGFNRRVSTLAARLIIGVDTLETIQQCPNFRGNPLLSTEEINLLGKYLTS